MVDALEENVMKDILSMGLEEDQLKHQINQLLMIYTRNLEPSPFENSTCSGGLVIHVIGLAIECLRGYTLRFPEVIEKLRHSRIGKKPPSDGVCSLIGPVPSERDEEHVSGRPPIREGREAEEEEEQKKKKKSWKDEDEWRSDPLVPPSSSGGFALHAVI
ncbi:hypothetical protein EYF80_033587 [Liparis tanakae]|uniref:Uncharacterized protein n=1 Tax=Liparis tanakae TaxID=230148 RepID=A0A4Z2GSC3_9TELE|nr:hypothetical protein EYF80_033587 [Liparis tanakae]